MTYVAYHIDYLENNNIFGAIVSWSECANEYTGSVTAKGQNYLLDEDDIRSGSKWCEKPSLEELETRVEFVRVRLYFPLGAVHLAGP